MRLFKQVAQGLFPWDATTQIYEIAKIEKVNFISLYLPFVDAVSLRFGFNSLHTERVAKEVYSLDESLAKDLSNDLM